MRQVSLQELRTPPPSALGSSYASRSPKRPPAPHDGSPFGAHKAAWAALESSANRAPATKVGGLLRPHPSPSICFSGLTYLTCLTYLAADGII